MRKDGEGSYRANSTIFGAYPAAQKLMLSDLT